MKKIKVMAAVAALSLLVAFPVRAESICETCSGSGQVEETEPCTICGGSGTVEDWTMCMSCDGGYEDVMCSSCGGMGTDESGEMCGSCYGNGFVREPCSVCDGSGLVMYDESCYHCGGSGTETTLAACPDCGGTGIVEDESDRMNLFITLLLSDTVNSMLKAIVQLLPVCLGLFGLVFLTVQVVRWFRKFIQ